MIVLVLRPLEIVQSEIKGMVIGKMVFLVSQLYQIETLGINQDQTPTKDVLEDW